MSPKWNLAIPANFEFYSRRWQVMYVVIECNTACADATGYTELLMAVVPAVVPSTGTSAACLTMNVLLVMFASIYT